MAYYTFTAADIAAIAAQGVTATFKGATLKNGDTFGGSSSDTIVFTCNSGKKFNVTDGITSVNFVDTNGTNRVNFTLTNGETVATKTGSLPSGAQPWNPPKYVFNISTDAAAKPVYYKFIQSDIDDIIANHFKLFVNGVELTTPTNIHRGDVLTVVANDGYKFKMNSGGLYTSLYFYGNTNNYFFIADDLSVKNGTCNIPDDAVIPDGADFACTGSTLVDDTPAALEWVLHPASGVIGATFAYSWSGGVAPYVVNLLNPDGSVKETRPANNSTEYSFSTIAGDSVGEYTVEVYPATGSPITQKVNISAVEKPIKYTFTQADITMLVDKHCIMTINGVTVKAGDVARVDDVLIINAIDNYAFAPDTDRPRFSWTSYGVFFNLSNSDKTATMVMATSNYVYDIFRVLTILPSPETLAGNNVYLVDNDKLQKITKNRFEFIAGSQQDTLIDYGNYILSVLQLPLTVDSNLIIGSESVKLATHDTGVVCNKLSTDSLNCDLGTIVIPETFNSLLDFDNTTAILYLPMAQPINIDVEYVVGEEISIVYIIDVYTGKATINITSSKTGGVIIQKVVDMGIVIPHNGDGGNLKNSNIELAGDNGVKTPYIEIVRSDAPLIDSVFAVPVIDEQVLNTQTGFITVENIDLNSKAIKSEKDEIINILNAGVIIK